MNLKDVWESVDYLRDEDEAITAAVVPIEMWRFLLDRVQEMEDREAARQRLARMRETQGAQQADE